MALMVLAKSWSLQLGPLLLFQENLYIRTVYLAPDMYRQAICAYIYLQLTCNFITVISTAFIGIITGHTFASALFFSTFACDRNTINYFGASGLYAFFGYNLAFFYPWRDKMIHPIQSLLHGYAPTLPLFSGRRPL